jgi:hypothetical protein
MGLFSSPYLLFSKTDTWGDADLKTWKNKTCFQQISRCVEHEQEKKNI